MRINQLHTDIKTLFMMGNKRSGTSLLVRLLNMHPNVFITHESDVIWTLYQLRNSRPDVLVAYSEDGPLGMQSTLKSAAGIYRSLPVQPSRENLAAAFFAIQEHLMQNGSDVQDAYPGKHGLAWIGDKKPVQQADPDIREFVIKLLPGTRFLHVVRNPYAVYNSISKAVSHWKVVPHYWKGGFVENLRRWLLHEEWVQEAIQAHAGLIHSMRYEDIISNPVEKMQQCFACLGLDMPVEVREKTHTMVRSPASQNQPPDTVPEIEGFPDMMRRYGYSLDGQVSADVIYPF